MGLLSRIEVVPGNKKKLSLAEYFTILGTQIPSQSVFSEIKWPQSKHTLLSSRFYPFDKPRPVVSQFWSSVTQRSLT